MTRIVLLLALSALQAACDGGSAGGGTETARQPARIYNGYCSNCHAGGGNGAPRVGPAFRMVWSDEMEEDGFEGLVNNAIHGHKAMPARGTCYDCSDEEIRATVIYMLKHSGAR
ncbi:MAG: c-type cytochrome [Alcanivorax sp.]|nr:c-type cytochrome [Alcanivorax sp.]